MSKKAAETAVLVTTQHRGVFFGYASGDLSARSLTLKRCRNIIYWSGTRGFLGLAAEGPDTNSRVGSEAPEVLIHDVTSVTKCTDEAAKKIGDWK